MLWSQLYAPHSFSTRSVSEARKAKAVLSLMCPLSCLDLLAVQGLTLGKGPAPLPVCVLLTEEQDSPLKLLRGPLG